MPGAGTHDQEEPPEAHPPDRLDSWKQIAAYLKCDERTVRRWEENEGLPVHRHQLCFIVPSRLGGTRPRPQKSSN